MTDKEKSLIDQAKHGSKEAVAQLYNRYYRLIRYIIYDAVKDDDLTADLLSTTFVKAYERLNYFVESISFEAWLKTIAINTVIDYVKNALSGLAKEKSIEILTAGTKNLPEIMADAQRLEQVLTNLLSNAIKFTPEGRKITIRSELKNAADIIYNPCFSEVMAKLKGDYIVVSVEDEGIGIAEAGLLHVFDKFAQIENSLSRKVGGSGLGLPIAKQLLEAHNGAIWCESEIDKGSKFHFALPVEMSAVKGEAVSIS